MAGRDVWRKADADGDSCTFGLGIFDAIARGLDIDALRPPPHPGGGGGGGGAKQIEARRLAELGAQRVCVPRVLGESASTLLLSNLGDIFAAQLRAADGDIARIDALTTAVIDAIADTHARSAYLGQPLPRNITLDDSGRVGFIDFEEDPLASPGSVAPRATSCIRSWSCARRRCCRCCSSSCCGRGSKTTRSNCCG